MGDEANMHACRALHGMFCHLSRVRVGVSIINVGSKRSLERWSFQF